MSAPKLPTSSNCQINYHNSSFCYLSLPNIDWSLFFKNCTSFFWERDREHAQEKMRITSSTQIMPTPGTNQNQPRNSTRLRRRQGPNDRSPVAGCPLNRKWKSGLEPPCEPTHSDTECGSWKNIFTMRPNILTHNISYIYIKMNNNNKKDWVTFYIEL